MATGLPYNGWPANVRHGRDRHDYEARDRGLLPHAGECLCCKISLEKPVPYHAEEYGPTLEDYWASCVALCHRCHAMLHARFETPNLWKKFVGQATIGSIDESLFPNGPRIAPLLSRFKNRADEASCDIPSYAHAYFRSLSLEEHSGPEKVATLLVEDLVTGERIEVPDWTIYGTNLERLSDQARLILRVRGVEVEPFLSGQVKLKCGFNGAPIYKKLYAARI